jgi:hypothetical protein
LKARLLANYRNIKRDVKPARTDEQLVLYVFFAGSAVMAVNSHSFDRQRSIESVGVIVEDEDGVAGVGNGTGLSADGEVFLGVFLRDDFTVIPLQDRDANSIGVVYLAIAKDLAQALLGSNFNRSSSAWSRSAFNRTPPAPYTDLQ